MLCTRCLRATATAAATTTRRALPTARYFTTSPAARNAAEPALSTPTTKPGQEVPHPVPQTRSVCKEGTILTGLNFIKGKEDPVALRDEQYPEWLWSCLDSFKKGGEEGDEDLGDEFAKSKKQRRIAMKRRRTLEAKLIAEGNTEALAPKIPLQHQSINLPGEEDGTVQDNLDAADGRQDLKRAMRKARKSKIKEDNYLKSM